MLYIIESTGGCTYLSKYTYRQEIVNVGIKLSGIPIGKPWLMLIVMTEQLTCYIQMHVLIVNAYNT